MKKILFVLLIAIIATMPLPEPEDPILESIDWKAAWAKVKKVFKDAVQWLKDNDLYEPLINLIKKYGREAGLNFCKGDRKIPEDVCISIVNFIIDNLIK